MPEITTFTTDKELLSEILKDIVSGKIQLPEFQRRWIWDDDHIKSLLTSVSLSYPIGAIMILETGNPDVNFKHLPIEGVDLSDKDNIKPEYFILDGQQRLTSLFQSLLFNEPVKTRDIKGKEIERWYYIDMKVAIDPDADREDAIISIPKDMKIRGFGNEVIADYSKNSSDYENGLFPLSKIFDNSQWRREYSAFWNQDNNKNKLFDEFEKEIIDRFKQYTIPLIKLKRQTPKEAVCQIFEVVNTGGVSLDVFELLTATFAADGFNLREDWEGEKDSRGRKIGPGRSDKLKEHKVLKSVTATDFLGAITLLSTYAKKLQNPEFAVSCKRKEVLKLKLEDYKKWAEKAFEGFIKTAQFLTEKSIFSNRDIPYNTQLVPLSAIFTVLNEKNIGDTQRQKLTRWYWCGVFGELYGSATESRFAKDIVEVLDWLDGGEKPSTVRESYFNYSRIYTLKTRLSAAYKGLYALLMKDKCLDFITGVPIDIFKYFEEKVDIHHIFPKSYCKDKGIEAKYYDSIINKTPISAKPHRFIGGKAPSIYCQKIKNEYSISEERFDNILLSHVIDVDSIRSDNFSAFFEARKEALLERIEMATGKKIVRETEKEIADALDQEPEYTEDEVNNT